MAYHDRNLKRGAAQARLASVTSDAVAQRKIGVLLCNLGTPDGTGYWPMRRYLAEFLSDRRVIEVPRLLWFFILNGLILTTRPGRKGKDYATIWNRERDESPLKTITRAQAERLQASIDRGLLARFPPKWVRFGDEEARQQRIAGAFPGSSEPEKALGPGPVDVVVDWGMRYGNPSLEAAIGRLAEQGCDRLLLVPLYPQYSAASTATACDKVFETLAKMRRQPTLRVAAPYYDAPDYIEQIARSIERRLGALEVEPEVILASFHGMPADMAAKGDPYDDQCRRTVEALRRRLGLSPEKLMLTFQSRFGRAEWLKPYTDSVVKALAALGVKRLAVVTPGFSADCLETLEEIGAENAGYFLEAGGETFVRIDCLNDTDGGMRVIEAIVQRELQGWV